MKKKKGSWIVTLRCVVEREVVCDGCTKEQAESNPFDYSTDHIDIRQIGWELESIKENK